MAAPAVVVGWLVIMMFNFVLLAANVRTYDLARTVSLEAAAIEKAKEAIAALSDEIAALEAGIKALDKSVAEATEQRKEENFLEPPQPFLQTEALQGAF